jgi:hypothetical protein
MLWPYPASFGKERIDEIITFTGLLSKRNECFEALDYIENQFSPTDEDYILDL